MDILYQHFSYKSSEVKIGFYAPRSHDIIGIDTCLMQDEIADKVVKLTKQWIAEHNIDSYDETEDKGRIRHIMIRRGFKTSEVMVVLVTRNEKLPYYNEFVELMVKNINGLKQKGIKADVVVVDPPRKDCKKSLLNAISSMQPERIVYVSSDSTCGVC